MSRSPHPLLDRLHRGGGTPSQLLARAQAAQSLLDSIGGGLQRVGFGVNDPWARLLEVPLDPGASGLQTALDRLAAGDLAAGAGAEAVVAAAEAAAVARRAQRVSSVGADGRPSRGAAAGALAHATRRPSRPLAGAPVQLPAVRPRASAAALTPQAAAAAWQQRAAAAGPAVEGAFFSPLRAREPPRAIGSASESARAQWPMQLQAPARPAPRNAATTGANTGASLQQVAFLPAPVLPRLEAALARIEQGGVALPIERLREATREWRSDAGARFVGAAELPPGRSADIEAPGGAAPSTAVERAAIAHPAASNPLAASARGFRGLAARAAASAASSPQRSPAAEPGTPRTPDDEQLVEQIARVLRREAERDGIDTSDIAP